MRFEKSNSGELHLLLFGWSDLLRAGAVSFESFFMNGGAIADMLFEAIFRIFACKIIHVMVASDLCLLNFGLAVLSF